MSSNPQYEAFLAKQKQEAAAFLANQQRDHLESQMKLAYRKLVAQLCQETGWSEIDVIQVLQRVHRSGCGCGICTGQNNRSN